MHILFLTTNNLATNPRLYKEVQNALRAGYRATVAMYRLGNWSDDKSKQLLGLIENPQLTIVQLDATPNNRFTWLFWGLLEIKARIFGGFFRKITAVQALASSRRSIQLLWACRHIEKPDLVAAHNFGALYPAYALGKKWNIPFVFDVEDYHPGESIKKDAKNEKVRREFLIKTLLPKATAITSASPLIDQYTMNLIGGHPNHQVILNSFPQNEFRPPHSPIALSTNDLRLVWFSQKISFGRGLEQLFDALLLLVYHDYKNINNLSTNPTNELLTYPPNDLIISLTLIGDLDSEFNHQIIEPFKAKLNNSTYRHNKLTNDPPINLIIHPPLSQQDLHTEMANHDVGLALESGKDLNNNLAISNKIIAYAQAGLYILATDTPAQKAFMEEQHGIGIVCGQTSDTMTEALKKIIENKEDIKQKAMERFEKGRDLSWEIVSTNINWMSTMK